MTRSFNSVDLFGCPQVYNNAVQPLASFHGAMRMRVLIFTFLKWTFAYIVMEENPLDDSTAYYRSHRRLLAEGIPISSINTVVHNVKYKSEGHINDYAENNPSNKVRNSIYNQTTTTSTSASSSLLPMAVPVPWFMIPRFPSGVYESDPYANLYGTFDEYVFRKPFRPKYLPYSLPNPVRRPSRIRMSRPNYVFPEETAAYTDSSAGRRNDAASRKSSQIPSVEDGATRDKTNNDGVDAVTTQMPKGTEHLMDQESSAEDDGQTDASVDETTIKSIKIKKMTTVKTIETKDEIESGTDVSSKQTLNDERKPKEKEKLMKSLKPENRSEKKLDDTPLVKVDGEVKVPKAIDGETKNRRQKSETNGEDNKHKISDDMRRIEHTRKEEDKKDRKDYSEEQDNKETEEDNMGSNEQFDENIRKQELMKGNATEEKTINENDEECEPDDILKYSIDITSSVKAIQSTTDKISSEEDDYYNFDITKEDNDDESEPVKEKANKVKKWKQINKKGRHEKIRKRKEKRLERKCRKYIEKKNELALQNVQNTGEKIDYQFSKEIMSKMGNGHVIDEVHASEDLEKMEPNEKKQAFDLNCASETDEFPQKCIAWQKAGFCESNQATQYLWCRKTCLCRWRNKRS